MAQRNKMAKDYLRFCDLDTDFIVRTYNLFLEEQNVSRCHFLERRTLNGILEEGFKDFKYPTIQ